MRGFNSASLTRFAIVALMSASFALPVILGASSADARAPGTAGQGPSGPTGGASSATGGPRMDALAVLAPNPRPVRLREPVSRRGAPRSCYQAEPMFDRWGDYVGARQNDFCW